MDLSGIVFYTIFLLPTVYLMCNSLIRYIVKNKFSHRAK